MKYLLILTALFCSFYAHGQGHHTTHKDDHFKKYRVAVLIGHTMIQTARSENHIFIPSWGLDIEYWHSHKWGIGLHNDIEIENFIIRQGNDEEIERINPLVITLDGLYHFKNGLILTAGPGIEIAHGSEYGLVRLGLEYEKEIGGGYDIAPTLFFDQRFDGFSTWSFALGIGKRF